MKFKVDGVQYDLDETTLTNLEVMDIEARCGCTYGEWISLLGRNSMQALTALVWIGLRREKPDLKYSDVKFEVGEIYDIPPEDGPDEVPPTPPGDGSTPNGPLLVLEETDSV